MEGHPSLDSCRRGLEHEDIQRGECVLEVNWGGARQLSDLPTLMRQSASPQRRLWMAPYSGTWPREAQWSGEGLD